MAQGQSKPETSQNIQFTSIDGEPVKCVPLSLYRKSDESDCPPGYPREYIKLGAPQLGEVQVCVVVCAPCRSDLIEARISIDTYERLFAEGVEWARTPKSQRPQEPIKPDEILDYNLWLSGCPNIVGAALLSSAGLQDPIEASKQFGNIPPVIEDINYA
ncbi:hypothetical protein BH23PAT2_BH23PAT2_01210 [soil metagenome]